MLCLYIIFVLFDLLPIRINDTIMLGMQYLRLRFGVVFPSFGFFAIDAELQRCTRGRMTRWRTRVVAAKKMLFVVNVTTISKWLSLQPTFHFIE
jgi:hypothetical protein